MLSSRYRHTWVVSDDIMGGKRSADFQAEVLSQRSYFAHSICGSDDITGRLLCRDFQAEVEPRAEADRQNAGMTSSMPASNPAPRKVIKGAVYGSEEQAAEEPEISLQVAHCHTQCF